MEKIEITDEIVESHGLSKEEYEKVLQILGREPNMVELGIFSVMWSEHCSYKSSRVHLKNFPTEGPQVIQGPGENAGVVDIGDGLAVAFKMESHNHPSFIEPYQGAATGVGGIMRDVFTMGARPVANLNSLRFGNLDLPKHKYLLKGVVAGIAGYGNCMGVPTVGGEVYFDDCYNGNILVNAFTLGIVKSDKIFKGYASGIGNPVIYVGSKTGRDGIHGATMASEEFDEGSEEKRPTVQVGDPFTEKLLLEACLELMKTDYIIGIQDMGAAGLTSSSFEMASRAGTGIEMYLDEVPRREEGMTPYEIMLSESQERMLMVVKKGCEDKVRAIFDKWDLDCAVVGKVTDDGIMRLMEKGVAVAELPIDPLAEGAPVYSRPMSRPEYLDELSSLDLSTLKIPSDMNQVLVDLLDSPNIGSRRWIYNQYDHMVRTDTVTLPGSDAAVIRVKGTDKGVAMTVNCNSRYCYLDPYVGSMIAVAENARNLVCSGAKPLAITDCLNFGNPEKPEIMWQFAEAVRGLSDACKAFDTPVVSGNVSLYNETKGEAIYPTPTVGMVGLLENVNLHSTQYFKNKGDIIVLLGKNRSELGGSEYLKIVHGLVKGPPPVLDLKLERLVQKTCLEAIAAGIVESSHDCAEGGLAVALSEGCISGDKPMGANIELYNEGQRWDALLFGESQSRIVLSLNRRHIDKLEEIACNNETPLEVLGEVGGDHLLIDDKINVAIEDLQKAWRESLESRVS
ncbi:MAG: phosphoribosylformylglycinamidine synthase subunit PurL [Proteobacteria bacterium]|nr:phosphoribosylformylglycinamidine synthase subunit PurL [Pseudomonadota bacterium]